MIMESQIREQLGRYLEGESSFEQFEDWLVGNSYNMHKDSNQQAQNLVHDIDLVIYEYLDGNIMEDKLKGMLRSLLIQPRLVRVVVADTKAIVVTAGDPAAILGITMNLPTDIVET